MSSVTASSPTASSTPDLASQSITRRLLPFALMIFLGYGTIGLPLGVLPVHVSDALDQGPLVVGIAVALQAVVTLLTRSWAGAFCDRQGGKPAVLLGLAGCAGSGLLYLVSLAPAGTGLGLALLLLGRAVAGVGEGLFVTGALAWSIATVGAANAGRAMVWVGIALYGAIAAGGPAGLALQAWQGFGSVAAASALAPAVAGLLAMLLPAVRTGGGVRLPFYRVVGLIWRQGTGFALSAVGFGAISTFVALDFRAEGWDGAGYALAGFGGSYILVRLLLGHLPDRIGGAKVAAASLFVEILGLLLLWGAATPWLAVAGACLVGAGFSLVFPSFGIEAVKRVPPTSRGAALGGYVAFFDVGLALTGPVIGLVVAEFGYSAAFAAGAVAAGLALSFTLGRADR